MITHRLMLSKDSDLKLRDVDIEAAMADSGGSYGFAANNFTVNNIDLINGKPVLVGVLGNEDDNKWCPAEINIRTNHTYNDDTYNYEPSEISLEFEPPTGLTCLEIPSITKYNVAFKEPLNEHIDKEIGFCDIRIEYDEVNDTFPVYVIWHHKYPEVDYTINDIDIDYEDLNFDFDNLTVDFEMYNNKNFNLKDVHVISSVTGERFDMKYIGYYSYAYPVIDYSNYGTIPTKDILTVIVDGTEYQHDIVFRADFSIDISTYSGGGSGNPATSGDDIEIVVEIKNTGTVLLRNCEITVSEDYIDANQTIDELEPNDSRTFYYHYAVEDAASLISELGSRYMNFDVEARCDDFNIVKHSNTYAYLSEYKNGY